MFPILLISIRKLLLQVWFQEINAQTFASRIVPTKLPFSGMIVLPVSPAIIAIWSPMSTLSK